MTFVSDVSTRYVKQAAKCLDSALWEVRFEQFIERFVPLSRHMR